MLREWAAADRHSITRSDQLARLKADHAELDRLHTAKAGELQMVSIRLADVTENLRGVELDRISLLESQSRQVPTYTTSIGDSRYDTEDPPASRAAAYGSSSRPASAGTTRRVPLVPMTSQPPPPLSTSHLGLHHASSSLHHRQAYGNTTHSSVGTSLLDSAAAAAQPARPRPVGALVTQHEPQRDAVVLLGVGCDTRTKRRSQIEKEERRYSKNKRSC
jgi:hypothetical protein